MGLEEGNGLWGAHMGLEVARDFEGHMAPNSKGLNLQV